MSKRVTINEAQRLYVIPCGDGYTCFGFDNCYGEVVALAQSMGYDVPDESIKGNLECYERYLNLIGAFSGHPSSKKTWFQPGTDKTVQRTLERYRLDGRMLRIFLGDPATGIDWAEENDVIGYLGRSCGIMKVPLLLEMGERYGSAISTGAIVRMMDVQTNKEIWRTPNYQVPQLRCAIDVLEHDPSYRWAVFRDDSLQARFQNGYEAEEYRAFISGDLAAKHEHLRHAIQGKLAA